MRLAWEPGLCNTGIVPSNKRGFEGNVSDESVQIKKQCIEGVCTDTNGDELSKLSTKLEANKQQASVKLNSLEIVFQAQEIIIGWTRHTKSRRVTATINVQRSR